MCQACFDWAILTDEQKLANKAALERQKEEEARQQEHLRQQRQQEEEMRTAEKKKLQQEAEEGRQELEALCTKQKERRRQEILQTTQKEHNVLFQESSSKPPVESRDRHKKKAFVVWKSEGYPPDGFHSYDGPPEKRFDSSFDILSEANARAVFLFYMENPWGIDLEWDCEYDPVTQKKVDGALRLQIRPADSEEWTVGVVVKEPFAHL